jgi:hypothetical protein
MVVEFFHFKRVNPEKQTVSQFVIPDKSREAGARGDEGWMPASIWTGAGSAKPWREKLPYFLIYITF